MFAPPLLEKDLVAPCKSPKKKYQNSCQVVNIILTTADIEYMKYQYVFIHVCITCVPLPLEKDLAALWHPANVMKNKWKNANAKHMTTAGTLHNMRTPAL